MRYVEWISNGFSPEHYSRKSVKRFDVNFMSEILFGEEVKVYKTEEAGDTYLFEILHNDKPSCRARLIFRSEK